MRVIEDIELAHWCSEHSVVLDHEHRIVLEPQLGESKRFDWSDRRFEGREAELASAIRAGIGEWNECVVWITEWGVWPSSEDWPAFYRWRGQQAEKRSLETAPGHLFGKAEIREMTELLVLVLANVWGALIFSARSPGAVEAIARISHDEFLEVSGKNASLFLSDRAHR